APGSAAFGVGIRLHRAGEPAERPAGPFATMLSATPDYFQTIGVPLIAGRSFQPADRAGAPPVAIISESGARQLWQDPQRAIGQHLDTQLRSQDHYAPEIVGVVGDVRFRGVTSVAGPQVYAPVAQNPPYGAVSLVVDAGMAPSTLWPAVRDAVQSVDSD